MCRHWVNPRIHQTHELWNSLGCTSIDYDEPTYFWTHSFFQALIPIQFYDLKNVNLEQKVTILKWFSSIRIKTHTHIKKKTKLFTESRKYQVAIEWNLLSEARKYLHHKVEKKNKSNCSIKIKGELTRRESYIILRFTLTPNQTNDLSFNV